MIATGCSTVKNLCLSLLINCETRQPDVCGYSYVKNVDLVQCSYLVFTMPKTSSSLCVLRVHWFQVHGSRFKVKKTVNREPMQ